MKIRPKAVFFDIDGTLISRRGGPFPDDLEAMEEAARAGHFLFLNTGRSFANIPDRIAGLGIWSGIVAGTGAHVLLHEKNAGFKTIYHKWIPKEQLALVCSWYIENGKQLVLEGEKYCYMINPKKPEFSVNTHKNVTGKNDFSFVFTDDLITKLTIADTCIPAELKMLRDFFTINSFPDYSEAIIKGENKARGMKIALKAIGVKRKNSIALGDSMNDFDMIRYAGLGVAMGNAGQEIKAAADAVTADCGSGGAGIMLRRYVL